MKKENKIAVVGYACRYPDANNMDQFWQNILARRRAFRNMPAQRLGKAYFNADRSNPDGVYTNKAAVLKNYSFDRLKYKISNSNFQTADLAHWLALDVASEALRHASLEHLPPELRQQTGVIIGNTLTGEFSRANQLRLRWPYVVENIARTCKELNWEEPAIDAFLASLEPKFKGAFPEMEEDSLAGGLSNTIAGRICNYYDFKGGGYTIDGACSSSLLAVCKACDSINQGDLRLAIVGGVDLSLDPFELVGFSRAGALATREMMVYDRNANGFWPGEGCGFMILADYDFAEEMNLNIRATIKGWGISSDGKGGLTRPSVDGQALAIRRAYEKAGYPISSVSYLEGHGTGTSLGDATELSAILQSLEATPPQQPVYIGSVKANIGHTKAASGIAGLLKCLLVLENRVIPPVTGLRDPHPLFEKTGYLKPAEKPLPVAGERVLRTGVSSMGFGGINTHITLEEQPASFRKKDAAKSLSLSASSQDTELFLLAERSLDTLQQKLEQLHEKAKMISLAEMTDLSCSLYEGLQNFPARVAIEAAQPDELARKVQGVLDHIRRSAGTLMDTDNGIFFSQEKKPRTIGYLFPGQGNEALDTKGLLVRRFPFLQDLAPAYLKQLATPSVTNTGIAQPAIVSSSVTCIRLLELLGIHANVGMGHSLGELSALHWSGALDEADVIGLAQERGRLMHESREVKGKMLSVALEYNDPRVRQLQQQHDVSLACVNGPAMVVFAGSAEKIEALYAACKEQKIAATFLPVENAFHSNLMAKLVAPFTELVARLTVRPPERRVYSTVTAEPVAGEAAIRENLVQQLTRPVLFHQTLEKIKGQADLWVEPGAGTTMEKLTRSVEGLNCISLDATGRSVKGLLKLAGALFVSHNPINLNLLFENRFYRPLQLDEALSFLENPCEKQGTVYEAKGTQKLPTAVAVEALAAAVQPGGEQDINLLFRKALSEELDLPVDMVHPHTRMLDDLHLNSIYVGQLLAKFAAKHQLKITDTPSEYANASVAEIVQMFTLLQKQAGPENKPEEKFVEGIEAWAFPYRIEFREQPLAEAPVAAKKEAANTVLGHLPEQLAAIRDRDYLSGKPVLFACLYGESEAENLATIGSFLELLKGGTEFGQLVILQRDRLAGSFARSIYLENNGTPIRVLEAEPEALTESILAAEIGQPEGFVYARYTGGGRLVPELAPLVSEASQPAILPAAADNILVTGGARGITFECARALALKTGCRLVLMGRTDPARDAQVRENLSALETQGIRALYRSADITNSGQVAALFQELRQQNIPITGIVHGAGINKPVKIRQLSFDQLQQVLAAKLQGLRNLVSAADADALRFCISFGSIIGETGMEGNADYALANEWMRNEMERLSQQRTQTRFLNLAWSVWSGTGMGESLGVLEQLKQKGIQPITLDTGIRHFLQALAQPYPQASVVITGRHGTLPTLQQKPVELPYVYRFIDAVRVFYPQVELIADCVLSADTDLYLNDHQIEGQKVFPATFGLEAMAEAVTVLTGRKPAQLSFEEVQFNGPIVAGDGGKKIRIIVQRAGARRFYASIREESTAFKKDHFQAVLLLEPKAQVPELSLPAVPHTDASLEKGYLYNHLFFHKGSFRIIDRYQHLDPYHLEARGSLTGEPVCSDFLPQQWILPHPCANDAVLHAVQACIPHITLLPVRMEQVYFAGGHLPAPFVIRAEEKHQEGDLYTYDMVMEDEAGNLVSYWKGIQFRVLHDKQVRQLNPFLAQVVLQRKLNQLLSGRNGKGSLFTPDQAPPYVKRADGKPLPVNGLHLSKSHNGDHALLVASESEVAVDLESITEKTAEEWQLMLGPERAKLAEVVGHALKESYGSAATRVWGAVECLRKAGAPFQQPLVLDRFEYDGTAYLKSGGYAIISFKCLVNGSSQPEIQSLLLNTAQLEEI